MEIWISFYFFISFLCGSFAVKSFKTYKFFDRDITKFSPRGELDQVNFARKAGEYGGTVIAALSYSKQFALLVIPSTPKHRLLLDQPSHHKVMQIDDAAYLVVAGLAGDARAASQYLRHFAVQYRTELGCPLPPIGLSRALAEIQLEANVKGGKARLSALDDKS